MDLNQAHAKPQIELQIPIVQDVSDLVAQVKDQLFNLVRRKAIHLFEEILLVITYPRVVELQVFRC